MTRSTDEDKLTATRARGEADESGGAGLDRRDFVRVAGLGAAGLVGAASAESSGSTASAARPEEVAAILADPVWPSLRHYPRDRLARIALPLGGIGTGTVSLGGRGDLCDWEIMNRPAKGFVPAGGGASPFFALFARVAGGAPVSRILEGPLETFEFEGSHGSPAPNAGLPRFRECSFSSAYPFGRVILRDPAVPLEIHLKAFNPLVPADAETSGIPVASLTYELHNSTGRPVAAAVCGTLPNFIGVDGFETRRDWKGDTLPAGASKNRNTFRQGPACQGLFFDSEGVEPRHAAWGTMALVTPAEAGVTHRTSWAKEEWGYPILDFWDDFSADGRLDEREKPEKLDSPVGSLAVAVDVPPGETRAVTFVLAWHFPNRYTWTPHDTDDDLIGNHYTTLYRDAWDVAERTVPRLSELQEKTAGFASAVCESDLPEEVKESALFNVSTLRTQTCFRTPDGRFFGWEGSASRKGCCHGSCTHVWNYEQATPFLFGALAASMREVEFGFATSDDGLMSFRVGLPLSRGQEFGKAAADGQMGCILKMYRDWQLSGDEELLRRLWPRVRKAVEFCWIEGGWDADRDGVMEGAQHNTMDVEYYGPNPQMGLWYLGALRAAEEMARSLGDRDFAETCRALFESGRTWIDAHLFNGRYYEHEVRPPGDPSEIAPRLLIGMGSEDVTHPDYQLAAGCLVDQLVGQFLAHVCGLGHLVDPSNVRRSLESILRYNLRKDLSGHFNSMRSFALDSESALLMASYPEDRPRNPFPYFTEAMTGFEYTAAVGMLYEGMVDEGLECIRLVRSRYDGARRNPFDEAECGHHYARAMASWAAVLAWTGFRYSAVTRTLTLGLRPGRFFWSSGYGWGDYTLSGEGPARELSLRVRGGHLEVSRLVLAGFGEEEVADPRRREEGDTLILVVEEGATG
ncbi:MAG: non-lysosomal glucosylceramidase [Acidobacteria bacterium]|nr:non-lysosomal glucosylceramidase [Acidobacteriota bacterium]